MGERSPLLVRGVAEASRKCRRSPP